MKSKKIVKMKIKRDWIEFNYGVKGYEIEFQKAIIENLEANGIKGLDWWQAINKSIFTDLLNIYMDKDIENKHLTLAL